jgi:hypothetical protein
VGTQKNIHGLPVEVLPALLGRMSLEEFWGVIEATLAPAQEEQLERFRDALRRRNAKAIIEFQQLFAQYFFAAYNWDIWLVAWLCEGGMCSDDSFTDLRSWLISRGRKVFEMAMSAPDDLVDEITAVESPYFEEFAYVPSQVYRARIGENIPDGDVPRPKEPSGGNWLRPQLKDRSNSKMLNRCVVFNEMGNEEFAAIEKQFPKTWAYCLEKGIIKPTSPTDSTEAHPPSPQQIAATVDENLAKTNPAAYLKALGDAARQVYDQYKKPK